MIRTLTILASLPFLAACNLQDLIDPGAESKKAYEYRQSIIMTPAPDHIPDVGKMVEVVQKPECHEVFRVQRCSKDGLPVDWYYL